MTLAEKYGRTRGGTKGNVTFSSFDGSEQITIRVRNADVRAGAGAKI
ncbi:MAG: DUF3164 family protein [Enterobacteriaceae bacterium]